MNGSDIQRRSGTWEDLEHQVDYWFNTLPEGFRPAGRIEASSDFLTCLFPEIFYSIPMCAATTQHYHFARVLLLLHKPQNVIPDRNLGDSLRRHREIATKVTYHCREICGIAIGSLPGYVRIHMLQPLFVAGQCLEHPSERRKIVTILRGIEQDLGWATEYRVQQLLLEWGWETNTPI